MEYRPLSEEETRQLEFNNCWAENWENVTVSDGFMPNTVKNVNFYGTVRLGVFEKSIEVSGTFMKRSGIYNATLRNVTVGDNCLVENVGNYINNYVIGDDCYISNVCTMETTEGATFGEGNNISVLNEVGDGNVVTFHGLTRQNAALRVKPAGNAAGPPANRYMSNGEACAAFCGPFSASHHKSSLLIGGMFSFYNAGSATNFSNHAYKMGPMHYGTMERGAKTASGAYLLMPAHIGTFSVCFGKLMYHPDTRSLPFAYLIAYGDIMYLVPGRNLTTVGLYRDIRKWPKRDMRSKNSRKSIVNFDWLSPFSVGEILEGKQILERLREASGDNVSTYNYHEYVIKASSLRKGIKYYDIALRIYMGAVLKRHALEEPQTRVGTGKWNDLSGLLLPDSEEQQIVSDIADGTIESVDEITDRFKRINDNYAEYRWAWSYSMILNYYGLKTITPEDAERIHDDYVTARRAWIAEIRKDAEKEFQLGDVEESVLENFISQLDKEIDFEDSKLYL